MKAKTTVDRRAQIRQLLETNNVVSSQHLAERFNVSLMTIYRDLDSLQEQGIAKRQHGGAILANRFVSARIRGKRANEHLDAKRAIGRYAARNLIDSNDDAIIISAGSTTLEFVRQLPDVPINVMANSLEALSILGTHTHTNLYALGGELRKDVMAFGGAMTHENLKQCHFAKAFIGVDGIDMESGLTSTNEQTARISRLMAEQAEKVYILTDSSKFDQKSFRSICSFSLVDAIITNSGVPEHYREFLKAQGVALIEVDKALDG